MGAKPTYEELLKENATLRTEITNLKHQLHEISPSPDSLIPIKDETIVLFASEPPRVHRLSSPDEKIDLFMELFFGRKDVYARRYVSKKTGKAGYTPVCGNEWVRGICDKPKVKCSKCPNRNLLPLTKSIIYQHLRGKNPLGEDVIGIYPMQADETCNFLVADFDDKSWQEDVTVFRRVCEQYGLSVSVERSRSGNGGHVWFFFEEAIPCALARRLGSGLLTAAMEERHDLNFASYDRLLPNQDTMPSGGFGNLIALPLQGLARKSDNSVFVDEQMNTYPDQWAYLSGIKPIPLLLVENMALKLTKGGELGALADPVTDSVRPWERAPVAMPLTQMDFPSSLSIVRANGLFIPKEGCSERALNRIRRLAAFKNPDFYKAQAMRLPTFEKPRIICNAWEESGYLCIPRGLESELLSLLEQVGISHTTDDQTEAGLPIRVAFCGELRDQQTPAAEALLAHNNGVLAATTAFGKTVTAAYMIAQKKINTLILVHTQALMNQWKASLERFLDIDESLPEQPKKKGRKKELSLIGCMGGGKNNLSGIIDIAIIASLFDDGDAKPLVRNYGLVIVDECHHVSAFRFESVLRQVSARYVYGLSATPTRRDGHHPIIFQQCGPIRYRVDAREQALSRDFSHTVIPRFTRFRKPVSAPENWQIAEIYTAVVQSKARNDLILRDVSEAIQRKRTPLLLTERVEHMELLAAELQKRHPSVRVFLLSGRGGNKQKRAILEELRAFPKDKPLAVVATGKYVGEGFDEPRLDTLFITMPFVWKGTLAQYTGRLHRDYEGKENVFVYDYVDVHIPVLENMYHKRLSGYAALGYMAGDFPSEVDHRIGTIFNQKNFFAVFAPDVGRATNEVLIVSPYLSKSRVGQMKELFSTAALNGADIIVLTRSPEAFADSARQTTATLIQSLEESGVRVLTKDRIHQKIAVIDRQIVWYGSINFLSYCRSEESVMRFENTEIAEELLSDLAGYSEKSVQQQCKQD